jgi:hypothetical protein
MRFGQPLLKLALLTTKLKKIGTGRLKDAISMMGLQLASLP